MSDFVLTVACVSRRGIVAAVASFLAENGCNITDSAQFDDQANGRFFMRVSFRSETGATGAQLREAFPPIAEAFGMDWAIHEASHRMRVLLMVSGFGHCLNDILYRWRIGALPIDITGVVSNHLTYQKLVVNHDIPFHHVPITPDTKPEAEARLRGIVDDHDVDTIALARYMQVLSPDLCRDYSGRIINIHHSLLPSFKGAKPYTQAHDRGVKVIGATAHYVTADLDEGPIIEQEVVRIDHTHDPRALQTVGRDAEALALARAVRWHCERRVLVDGHRTVVFR